MKLMIASDIHGSAYWCGKLMEAYEREAPDKLLLLGDILYHGPRNDLPQDYAPKKVIEFLNMVADRVLCVRGNCDSEVDDMVLDFSVLGEYAVVCDGGLTMYACHGHRAYPKASGGNMVLSGHTHVPLWKNQDGVWFFNPGSVSIPKEDSSNSYMIYENGEFCWKKLEGEVYHTEKIS